MKGDRKDNFPNLQVRYKKGASPVLRLLETGNTVADTLSYVQLSDILNNAPTACT